MTNASSYNRIPWLTLALLLMTALPAAGQVSTDFYVVDDAYAVDYGLDPDENYTDVQEAINAAITLSETEGTCTVNIVARDGSAAWPGGVTIPPDADIEVVGLTRNGGADVYEAVLDGGGANVITISTADAGYQGGSTNLLIQDLHLTNGSNGIVVESPDFGGASPHIRPIINRCWIDWNAGHGVAVQNGNATALLTNCSITDNDGDGVHINTTPDPHPNEYSDYPYTDILHCTIIENGLHGVYVNVNQGWTGGSDEEPPKYARVRNTIVYDNGSPSDDRGGLVWSDGLSIIPNWAYVSGGDPIEGDGNAEIYGQNLTGPSGDTRVFFGPRDIGDHNPGVLYLQAGSPDRIFGPIPPAYNSAPGKVDVHIVREFGTENERTYTLNDGFTYVEVQTQEPYVTLVTPAHGPPEGGNWVHVEGVRFNDDGEVWFDANGNGTIDGEASGDLLAQDRMWLSSALLYVKVPPAPPLYNTAPMDVLVRNLYPPGASQPSVDSPPGGIREYTYRAKDALPDQPDIVQITPNFYRRLNTDAPDWGAFTVDILGWNFKDDGPKDSVTVRIGGEMCPYQNVDVIATLPEGDWCRIKRVEVPLAEFGAGGSYDVEVTNPNGLHDTLPSGFTYFADGTPLLDDDGSLPLAGDNQFEWLPSNFIDYNTGPMYAQDRTLFGDNFDAGLRITFDDLAGSACIINDPLNNLGERGADGIVMPDEYTEQHRRHRQRFIDFELPARPDDADVYRAFLDRSSGIPPWVPAFNTASLQVTIENVLTADYGDSYGPDPVNNYKRTTTHFYWIQNADAYFEITGTAYNCSYNTQVVGTAVLAVAPSDAATSAHLFSWTVDDIMVYVDNKRIPDIDITLADPPLSGHPDLLGVRLIGVNLTSLPPGFYGQKDVTVVLRASSPFNPVGEDLYWTMKDGVHVPPPVGRLYARAVHPRTVPATPASYEQYQVRVLGSGLVGPYPGSPASHWPWTDVELRWNSGPAAVALSVASVPEANYTVVSFYEAVFEAFDVTAHGVPTSSPGNINPVDVALVTYNGCTGLPVAVDVIEEGIVFWEFLPRIISTNVSPKAVASGASGTGGPGTFTVAGAGWEPGAYGGHYLIDSSSQTYMIKTNTDEELTLYSGDSPTFGAWRIVKGAFPLYAGGGGTWDPVTEKYTITSSPSTGELDGAHLIDRNDNSFLIRNNIDNVLTLHHHTLPVPADGGWRVVQPVHWGPVSGGDLLNIEGLDFPLDSNPFPRIGPAEARTIEYNSGFLKVRTPPAPFGLPATYDVSAVWRISDALNPAPIPVEARAPESERFTYIMDGPPEIIEIEPSQIYVDTSSGILATMQPEQQITITGYNFDDRVVVTFVFTDESGDAPTTAVVTREHFSVSPNRIVIEPPDFMRLLDPLLHGDPNSTLDDYDNGTDPLAGPPDGLPDPTSPGSHYEVVVTVTNLGDGPLPGPEAKLTSNPESIYYVVDNDDLVDPFNPDLLFNDVYLNYRNYVNVDPGTGSISIEPMFLPEGAPPLEPTPDTLTYPDLAAPKPWWHGKLEVVSDSQTNPDGPEIWQRDYMNPMRDKASRHFLNEELLSERTDKRHDYEVEMRPDGRTDTEFVQGVGPWSETPRLPDIGADEIIGEGGGGSTYPYWYYAEVVPNPVPAMDAGELQVQVRVYGIIPIDPDGELAVYLVPQGVPFYDGALLDPVQPVNAQTIGLINLDLCIRVDLQRYGDGVYLGTNRDPIQTLILDVDGDGGPSDGDYLADGHAAIVMPADISNDGINQFDMFIGDDSTDPLEEGGFIVEQAITGRHFLIDTIPPRPVLTVAPAQPSNIMTLDNIPPGDASGEYAAQGPIAFGAGTVHPYPLVGDLGWRPLALDSPSGGPFDQSLGAIPLSPPDPPLHDGTQAFFNVGSISNEYDTHPDYGTQNLEVTIGPGITAGEYLAFLDPPPTYTDPVSGDKSAIQGNPEDFDYYTGLYTREVSGFPETLLGPVTVSDHTEPPTVVVFNNDSIGEPAIGEMTYNYTVSSSLPGYFPFINGVPSGNPGFDRDSPIGVFNYENDVIVSEWEFNDGGSAGIAYGQVSSGAPMHLNMRFIGVDLAGNVTGMGYNDGDALNSLHVWWMTEAETVILPDLDGEELSVLPFYWRINRATSEDPEAQDAAVKPRFIWCLWFSNSEDGPFTLYPPPPPPPPATPTWSTWSTDTQLADVAPGLAETLRQNGDGGMWFLLVVMGVDEAGNYEQWPNDLTLTGSDITAINGRSRKNWVRFYLTGGEIDTTLTHELWHNGTDLTILGDAPMPPEPDRQDENFGPADIIALHESSPDPRVEGLFRIGVELPPGLEGENIAVRWSLQRDGGEIYAAAPPDELVIAGYSSSGEIRTLQLPLEVPATLPAVPDPAFYTFDYMPEGQNSVSYVLTAQAFSDEIIVNGVWDPGERIDNTPATVRFRVVRDTDHSVEGYYRRERQRGKQQIILREE